MKQTRRFRKSEAVVERRIRGEHILVPVMSDTAQLDSLYTLNPTAGWIWEQALSGQSEAEICAALVREFDVERSVAERDVSQIIGELLAIRALEIAEV